MWMRDGLAAVQDNLWCQASRLPEQPGRPHHKTPMPYLDDGLSLPATFALRFGVLLQRLVDLLDGRHAGSMLAGFNPAERFDSHSSPQRRFTLT